MQLKDVQGHLYTIRNVCVQFSDPPDEPVPESKLRILLGEAVQSVAFNHQDDRSGGSVHIGGVSAAGRCVWGGGGGGGGGRKEGGGGGGGGGGCLQPPG